MDEQTLEKNDVLQELLKSEYDLAKHECECSSVTNSYER